MRAVLNDIRFGLRMLSKRPGFTAIVVLTLALGISVNTLVFCLVNALLFRPPEVRQPQELFEVWETPRQHRSIAAGYRLLSYPDYVFLRDHGRVFNGLLGEEGDLRSVTWNHAGAGNVIYGKGVSGNYFSVLGIRPAIGRDFRPEEDQTPGTHPVAMLAYDFWQRQCLADPTIIGKGLVLNGNVFTVVGVAPSGFSGIIAGFRPDFWVPLMMVPQIGGSEGYLTHRGNQWVHVVGRQKPGLTLTQIQAEVELLSSQLAQTYPDTNKEWTAQVFPATQTPAPLRSKVSRFSGILLTAVAFVLLIACANTMNLFWAKAIERRHELNLRMALGANRIRLFGQLLVESLLLAGLGGSLGVVLTLWAAPLLARLEPPTPFPIRIDLPLDWRVLGFASLLTLVAGLGLGVLPALRGPALALATAMKTERDGTIHHARLRGLLIIAEVSVCYVLLIGAGLCMRSWFNAQAADPGFKVDQRLLASLDTTPLKPTPEKSRELLRRLVENVAALPGVQSASLATWLPLGLRNEVEQIVLDGSTGETAGQVKTMMANWVGPGYFRTLGIPVRQGREFNFHDVSGAPSTVIINETLAQLFWPCRNAMGQRLYLKRGEKVVAHEIVGLVRDAKHRTLSEAASPVLYLPFFQADRLSAMLIVHSTLATGPTLARMRAEVQALDARLALNDVKTLRQHIGIRLFPARIASWMLEILALLALALSVVGLSGVVACYVSQRTREIGIRRALGAQRGAVLWWIIRQGMQPVIVGVALGALGAFGLTRFLASFLYGLSPLDPLTFGIVSLTFLFVALLACWLPARSAANVDPMVALRYE